MGRTITINEWDILKEKISADSAVVASFSKSIAVSVSFRGVSIRSLCNILFAYRLLKIMDKLDAGCFNCAKECESDFTVKTGLEKMISAWNETIQKKEKKQFPKIILRLEKYLLEQFENKLENYWIASDKEIKKFAYSISEKLDKHAIQRTV